MNSLCYIILTHSNLKQTAEIIKILDGPGIGFIVHIDKKCTEDSTPLLNIKSVTLASKRFNIEWGDGSMVKSVFSIAKQALDDNRNFNYFVLLSGQCVPVKNSTYIRNYFFNNAKFSFLKAIPIPSKQCEWLEGGRRRIECYPVRLSNRDMSLIEPRKLNYGNLRQIGKTILNFKVRPIYEMIKTFLFAPKRQSWTLQPYGGEFWWRMNRRCLESNIKYTETHSDFESQIDITAHPDEIIFNTLSFNLDANVKNDLLTYINWKDTNTHSPEWITLQDKNLIDKLIENPDILFCRKVKDFEVIEYIKEKLIKV
ncbi:MAG: beta-1,6-N-acetylglucosaminyltransferase [Bacteroides sp.]|nr:beta-1,6-N-acetylglucosaminyltransferase [Bacteroides sp.]